MLSSLQSIVERGIRACAEANRATRITACIALILAYWAVGFWPYDFRMPLRWQPNDATWTVDGGLAVSGRGIARVDLPAAAGQPRSLTVELDLASARRDQSGPARILTWSPDPLTRNFTIGQDGSVLVVRVRRAGSNSNGMPEIRVDGVFDQERKRLAVSVRGTRLVVFVDGQQRHVEPIVLERWDLAFPLSIGNEPGGNRPWRGTLFAASMHIDSRVIFDLADPRHDVRLPAGIWRQTRRLQRMHRFALQPFQRWRWRDVLINTLGFMPFGAFVAVAFPRRKTVQTLLFACGVSLLLSFSIEFAQLGFRGRFPSGTDLVTNGLGGLLGALLAKLWPSRSGVRVAPAEPG